MPDYSLHYGLIILNPSENFSEDDYAFTRRNITNIDHKLYLGAEAHVHDGGESAIADPDTSLQLTVTSTGGNVPGGTTIYYSYTWVDQYGAETAQSPTASVSTPNPVSAPSAPTLSIATSGGTLLPGNYYYVLTAYKDTNTQETKGSARIYTTVVSGSTNVITLTLPALPTDADGFNVYRRGPGEKEYRYLASIDMSVATPPSDYDDDGGTTIHPTRTIPRVNTTATGNSVSVELPGATPSVPDGYTWKLYRSYVLNDWDASLLHWVVEETEEGSGVIETTYSDVGAATGEGTPPSSTEIIGSPGKVNLANMAHVDNRLPPAGTEHVTSVTFQTEGTVATGDGIFSWPVPWEKAVLKGLICSLAPGSAPASTDVQIDVNKGTGTSPSYSSIVDTGGGNPGVPAGQQLGSYWSAFTDDQFSRGDSIRIDVGQDGGGTTPEDENLTVVLEFFVYSSVATNEDWSF